MNYLIIDDEDLSRKRMQDLMKAYPRHRCIGQARNGIEAVDLIMYKQPDFILLDVEMAGLSGFEVLNQLRATELPLIIFVTAFDQYAINAFEVEALDYLVKPVSTERLDLAITRLEKRQHSRDSDQTILKMARNHVEQLTRIPVFDGIRIKLLAFHEIRWFEFDDRLVFAQTTEGRYLTRFDSLKGLEDRLLEQDFIRINRNYLVQTSYIAEIKPINKTQYQIIMEDIHNQPLLVSRQQSKTLRKKIKRQLIP